MAKVIKKIRTRAKIITMTSGTSKLKFKLQKSEKKFKDREIQDLKTVRNRYLELGREVWQKIYQGVSFVEGYYSDFFLEFLGLGGMKVTKVDDKHYRIDGLFNDKFKRDVEKYIHKGSKLLKIFEVLTERRLLFLKSTYIIIHEFFIPDLYAILLDLYAKTGKVEYAKKALILKKNTWLRLVDHPQQKTKLYMSKLKDIKWSLKSFQEEFIRLYPEKKDRLGLRGYILAFDQGLGKTFTSLVLMHLLNKRLTIIICPKTLMFNWKDEIQNIFKHPPSDSEIYLVGESDKLTKDVKYVICNYERLSDLQSIISALNAKNIGLIVDECQNFRNIKAKRTQQLIKLTDTYKKSINDILLLSGTPIKSNYAELAPYLRLIDPRFDDEALEKWLKVFNVDESIASDIIRYRMSLISHRKLKTEVLKLPPKKHITQPVVVPNVEQYTLETFKKLVKERAKYYYEQYKAKFGQYYDQFLSILNEILSLAKQHKQKDLISEIQYYIEFVKQTEEGKLFEKIDDKELIKRILQIEKHIESFLSSIKAYNLKKQFKELKTIVTRITYKAIGKAFGEVLHSLREKMILDIFKYNIQIVCKFIEDSSKTVIFTYVSSVIPKLKELIQKSCKVKVVTITGATKDRGSVIKKFKTDPNVKVIIASYQVAAVGLTLTEADTMIYADKPYREADLKQAEDRIYRIGQDKPVKIIYLKLKSSKPTIQDRIDEIVKYFGTIVKQVL